MLKDFFIVGLGSFLGGGLRFLVSKFLLDQNNLNFYNIIKLYFK